RSAHSLASYGFLGRLALRASIWASRRANSALLMASSLASSASFLAESASLRALSAALRASSASLRASRVSSLMAGLGLDVDFSEVLLLKNIKINDFIRLARFIAPPKKHIISQVLFYHVLN